MPCVHNSTFSSRSPYTCEDASCISICSNVAPALIRNEDEPFRDTPHSIRTSRAFSPSAPHTRAFLPRSSRPQRRRRSALLHQDARIIAASWSTLTRYPDRCETFVDPKSPSEPTLYFPAGAAITGVLAELPRVATCGSKIFPCQFRRRVRSILPRFPPKACSIS